MSVRKLSLEAEGAGVSAPDTLVQCSLCASPVILNHTWLGPISMLITPTMWFTGSVSMTAKLKWGSSKASGSEEGPGRATQLM